MSAPTTPNAVREHFLLEPDLVFLNHGSFGACPRPVLDAQSRLRERMEENPVRFFVRDLEGLRDEARRAVAELVGASPEDVVFVRNATEGVNSVLASVALSPGDEVLTTDHGYHACDTAVRHVAARAGARMVVATLPFPIDDPAEVTEAIVRAAGPKTRLALVDHVTSPTGLVLPIADIVRALDAHGIDTLVDGAHGPGMLPLDLDALGAAYYTGNFHKWCCAPKGAAMLWVRRDRQDGIHPAITSHGWDSTRERARWLDEFDWPGTHDPTPFLCVPEALRFLDALLPGGLAAVREHNRALALEGRRILCEALGQPPLAPDSMIGALAAVRLPDGPDASPPTSPLYVDPLQLALHDRHRIEVPVPPWPAPPKRLLRVSAQVYNRPDDYHRLARALRTELDREHGSRER